MYTLPLWVLPNSKPGFYDTESATTIEQTAKVYKAMQDLISEYNSFATNVNKIIEDFISGSREEYDTFKVAIRQEFQDFIDVIDLKIAEQDKIISDKSNELDGKYTAFTNSIQKIQKAFKTEIENAISLFEQNVDTKIEQFENDVNTYIQNQDKVIEDAVSYMKTNLPGTIENLVYEMRENGELGKVVMNVFQDILNSISKEETDRKSADNTLQNNISNEALVRQQALLKEREERVNGDALLNARVDAIEGLAEGVTPEEAELVDIRVGHDGTLHETAGTSVRTQILELHGKKVDIKGIGQVSKRNTDFYQRTSNIRDEKLEEPGYINTNTGLDMENDNTVRSDFIIVVPGNTIGLQNFPENEHNQIGIHIYFYTDAKEFISEFNPIHQSSLQPTDYMEIPENACYVRYTIDNLYINDKFCITTPFTILDKYIEPYKFLNKDIDKLLQDVEGLKTGEKLLNGSITPEKTSFFEYKENMFNINGLMQGAIFWEGGYFDPNFDGWFATDFIPVFKGITYYLSYDKELYPKFTGALYNSNKVFVSGLNNQPIFTPEVNGFVRLSKAGWHEHTQLQPYEVTDFIPYGDAITSLKPEYAGTPSVSGNTEYKNKKVLLLGDSITHLDTSELGWVRYFNNIVQPSLKVNLAVDGATWRDQEQNQVYDGNPIPQTNGNCIGNQLQKVINEKANGNSDYADFDVIIIACGTNDGANMEQETIENVEAQFVSNYNYGSYTIVPLENVNRMTFAGIMRYTYEKLFEMYPNAKICICSPIQEIFESFESIYRKGELFRYIASRLSVNFFNTRDCGICNLYEDAETHRDLADGIHTNANGGRKLGTYIAKEFIKLYEPIEL